MPEPKIEDVLCVAQYYWHFVLATTLFAVILISGMHQYVACEIRTSHLVCVHFLFMHN